jgi:hypothetical protein
MKDNAKPKKQRGQKQCTIWMNENIANPNLQLCWLGAKPYSCSVVQKSDMSMTSFGQYDITYTWTNGQIFVLGTNLEHITKLK